MSSSSKKLIRAGQFFLPGPNGKERVSYLVHERGLRIDTIRQRRLGWLPVKGHMPSKRFIPCYDSKAISLEPDFRLTILILDRHGTESAGEAT